MGFNLLFISAFFTVAVIVSHATPAPEQYWNKVLPGTSMPKLIREFLNPEFMQNKRTSEASGKVGVNSPFWPNDYTPASGVKGKVGLNSPFWPNDYTPASGVKGKVGLNSPFWPNDYGPPPDSGRKGKVGLNSPFWPNHYGKPPATGGKAGQTVMVNLFFFEKELVPGKTFNLRFTKATGAASFLPREIADSIPFSNHNITNILNRFSINPQSQEANSMRETITICEEPGISGEQKYCATSLESMIDFSTKIIGKKNVKTVSTGSKEDTRTKKYKIEGSINSLTGDEEINALSVACHKLAYVYAVFYCHSLKSTKVYMVPLKSDDEIEVKAVAVCHEDTSKWNPKHMSFQMLKVKPGTVPVCHFLTDDAVVWYRN